MQTSIDLQAPFIYSVLPLVIVLGIIIVMTSFIFYYKKIKDKNKIQEIKIEEIPEKNIKNIPVIKGKYINDLDSIEYKFTNKMIELRKAYQLISETIRLFVFEITDIETQNYSLAEIKKLNIPNLYELIEEYYEPEFASKSKGDLLAALNKARRIIKEWN